jgi:hypothetical protein
MGKVVDLKERRFHKVTAGKVVNACNELDRIVHQLLFVENVPASELISALCQRIGVYLSHTDANREKVIKKLAKIIYKHSKGQGL